MPIRPAHAVGDEWSESFAGEAKRSPRLLGFKGVDVAAQFGCEATFEGRLPAGLQGTFYRNGPGLLEFAGVRYHHWIDGDGLLQSFELSENKVRHQSRLVGTLKLAKEQSSGKRRYSTFGTTLKDAMVPSGADSLNVANGHVIPFAGELLALWEGGSAFRVNKDTLEALGPKTWRNDLRSVPFSSHPKIEPTGVLWNFGLDSTTGTLIFYEILPTGTLKRAAALRLPDISMVHDFAVSENHLIFVLPPIRFVRDRFDSGETFLDSHEWLSNQPIRMLVVDKADLSTHKLFEAPNGFPYHLGNAWEEGRGTIRFDYVHSNDASTVMVSLRDVMRGQENFREFGWTRSVVLDLNSGQVRYDDLSGTVEFPRFDPRLMGQRCRNMFQVARSTTAVGPYGYDAVRRVDLETGAVDSFYYGAEFVVEEHVYVPDSSRGDASGFLVGTALDLNARSTCISVFDASNLASGPIARARLPYMMPLGMHGSFST